MLSSRMFLNGQLLPPAQPPRDSNEASGQSAGTPWLCPSEETQASTAHTTWFALRPSSKGAWDTFSIFPASATQEGSPEGGWNHRANALLSLHSDSAFLCIVTVLGPHAG